MHFKLIFPNGHSIFVEYDAHESVQVLSDVIHRHQHCSGYLLNCGGVFLKLTTTFGVVRDHWRRVNVGDSAPEIRIFRSLDQGSDYTDVSMNLDQPPEVLFSRANVQPQREQGEVRHSRPFDFKGQFC